ncbi:MAG: hypothetical protein K0Q72_3474, partial [Armatimonadetes bacterium]|nr:hypothetical protein [Armatimonadota bacterium]
MTALGMTGVLLAGLLLAVGSAAHAAAPAGVSVVGDWEVEVSVETPAPRKVRLRVTPP